MNWKRKRYQRSTQNSCVPDGCQKISRCTSSWVRFDRFGRPLETGVSQFCAADNGKRAGRDGERRTETAKGGQQERQGLGTGDAIRRAFTEWVERNFCPTRPFLRERRRCRSREGRSRSPADAGSITLMRALCRAGLAASLWTTCPEGGTPKAIWSLRQAIHAGRNVGQIETHDFSAEKKTNMNGDCSRFAVWQSVPGGRLFLAYHLLFISISSRLFFNVDVELVCYLNMEKKSPLHS